MKWNILAASDKSIIEVLLKNRNLKTKKEITEFLRPSDPSSLTPVRLGIDSKQLAKATERIQEAVKMAEPVVVYGDYDADGICSTAILWEALRDLGANVLPFIPQREKEGYGLSKEGIEAILKEGKYGFLKYLKKLKNPKGLIITVDSGIVAHEAVDYARRKDLEVIIIDHHEKPKKLPSALAIVHTTKHCSAAISYFFAKILNSGHGIQDTKKWLELAAIATVTDLMPLVGPNRSIVRFGLEALNKTSRPGLRALFSVAGIGKVGTYEIGFMIGPRINASGRIENALTALRLLCTQDFTKALEYAQILDATNHDRQVMTEEMTSHALQATSNQQLATNKIVIVEHGTYHQGVIGLIAGKLVDKYYLPAIVIAKGKEVSKASARSISGFNIIEAIRASEDILVNAGGHPMAAGFTIETSRISEFKAQIAKLAKKKITPDLLERQLRIDCELPIDQVSTELYNQIQQFAPFGLGNPEPVFCSEVILRQIRTVGQEGKHLKLVVSNQQPATSNQQPVFDAIAFGMGSLASQLKIGAKIKIAYSIDEDNFNGSRKLQLKIKDIRLE